MVGKQRRWGAIAAIASVTLAACSGGERPGGGLAGTAGFCESSTQRVEAFVGRAELERTPPQDDRYGGTVVASSQVDLLGGLNGFDARDYVAVQHQQFVGLMTLLQYDESLALRPYLASSWEVGPDTTGIVFRLRDDVFWHDGERTDAYDVAFTYQRMTDPETAFSNSAYFDHYVPGAAGVEVIDSLTVAVRLERPHAEFMDVWRAVPIMPEHLLGEVPSSELTRHPFGTECPVGNGPFVFVEHRPGESWTFRANPAFPTALGGRPFMDRYVLSVIGEPATQLAELLTEGTDVYFALPFEQVEGVEQAEGISLVHYLVRDYVFVAWNARVPKLSDSRVRRALTMGVDRERIVQALMGGFAVVAQTSVPPYHWAYDLGLSDAVVHDPEAAGRLLASAGWTDSDGDGVRENDAGERLTIGLKFDPTNSQRSQLVEIIQAQLRDVGVEIMPEPVEYATLVAQITDTQSRDFEGAMLAWANEFKLDDRDLLHSDRVDGPVAFSGTTNPELDHLLDTLQIVTDRGAAAPLWRRYQEAQVQEHPFTFFFFRERLVGLNDRIHDARMDVRGEWTNLKDWWIDPAHR